MRIGLITLFAPAFLAVAPFASAQDQTDLDNLTAAEAEAREAERALAAQEREILSEIQALKTQLQDQSKQTQAYEREGQRLQNELDGLNAQIGRAELDLLENRDSLQKILASLQRLDRAPNAALTATPDDAIRTAQTARLIQTLSASLQTRADRIVRLSDELKASREVAARRQEELSANQREIGRRRAQTAALVTEKEALQSRLSTDRQAAQREAERLASEATTLRELLERLRDRASRVKPRLKPRPGGGGPTLPLSLPPDTAPFADAKKATIKPVSGQLAKPFGRGEQGQTYQAPSQGQVVAPYAGRVEFSGPFKNYGRVVILNLGEGYFMLLTGLGETFVDTDEIVDRGEPIGAMPQRSGGTELYLELRRDGRTIDPAPWLS